MQIIETPHELNGYRVISCGNSRRQGEYIVIVVRPDHPVHPFVVASWWPELGSTWHQGDYVESIEDACAVATERSQRLCA